MKIKPTPFVARVFGALLVSSLLSQTIQAQGVLKGTATLADSAGVAADDLTVAYKVTDKSGVYTYRYTVSNPRQESAIVTTFEVGFDATSATVVAGSLKGGHWREIIAGSGLEWGTAIRPGHRSLTLSFESDEAPVFGSAAASDVHEPAAQWASTNPGGSQLLVPDPPIAVPEPATLALLAGTLLLLLPVVKQKEA
ncbi:MAG: hypothetical protein ABSA83_13275 [Verrucomicrobiota bacterium]